MKRNFFYILSAFSALVSLGLAVFKRSESSLSFSYITFPFYSIAQVLRKLSLSNAVGNMLAIALFVCILLVPLIYLFWRYRQRRVGIHDILLVLLAVVVPVTLYIFINPASSLRFTAEIGSIADGQVTMSMLVYILIIAYLVLNAIARLVSPDTSHSYRVFYGLLQIISIIFVVQIFGSTFHHMLRMMDALKDNGLITQHLLPLNGVFIIAKYLVDCLPYVWSVVLLDKLMVMFVELKQNGFSEVAQGHAELLAGRAALAIKWVIYSNVGFNIAQLFVVKSLGNINISLDIPAVALLIMLIMLIFARYIRDHRQLQHDFDLFI